MKYPTHTLAPADHLLFDLGYSAGMLMRTKEVLREIALCDDYPVMVDELLEDIAEFERGRLQLRSEIYNNAQAAVDLDRNSP